MKSTDVTTLLAQAQGGDRAALARLLTYAETDGPRQREVAHRVYRTPAPYVIGITGPPGAGKSTLTDALITAMLARGSVAGCAVDRVAVLAVDPSSPFTGGAILGDRIRMQRHSTDDRVFIRSMATRGHLGGLSLAVPDALRLLGAVGFPVVIVETVGVGQMEVEIAGAADATVVVAIPGAGDSLQANKAGLLEVADLFVVNKADRADAGSVVRDLSQMLDLGGDLSWRPAIVSTVATTDTGIDELVVALDEYAERAAASGRAAARRRQRDEAALRRVLLVALARRADVYAAQDEFHEAVTAIVEGRLDPYEAVDTLLS
jgi:LAO/AO transport system kinase